MTIALIVLGLISLAGLAGSLRLLYKLSGERSDRAALESQRTEWEQKIQELHEELDSLEIDYKSIQELLGQRENEVTALRVRMEEMEKTHKEKIEVYERAEAKMSHTFKSLSSDVLKSNSEAFLDNAKKVLEVIQKEASGDLDQRKQAVEELVKPIRENLEKVHVEVNELEKRRVGAYERLDTQIHNLLNTTTTLSRALSKTGTRGQWGELQLRRVVEMAGMLNHVDFIEQETTQGGAYRPDMIVNLPGNKRVIVDAKTPFDAYHDAVNAEDENLRKQLLNDHAAKVRSHIISLSKKSYWDQFDRTPEFVVLFLPSEAFFSAALEVDPNIIELGSEQKVIPATPTTLIALLKAVAYGWQQEEVAENAQKIIKHGQQLYERIAIFAGHFAKVGKGLDGAIQAYNKAVGSVERNVLVSARRFNDLSIGTSKKVTEPMQVEAVSRSLSAPEFKELNDEQ